jgi:hypothetical protein
MTALVHPFIQQGSEKRTNFVNIAIGGYPPHTIIQWQHPNPRDCPSAQSASANNTRHAGGMGHPMMLEKRQMNLNPVDYKSHSDAQTTQLNSA